MEKLLSGLVTDIICKVIIAAVCVFTITYGVTSAISDRQFDVANNNASQEVTNQTKENDNSIDAEDDESNEDEVEVAKEDKVNYSVINDSLPIMEASNNKVVVKPNPTTPVVDPIYPRNDPKDPVVNPGENPIDPSVNPGENPTDPSVNPGEDPTDPSVNPGEDPENPSDDPGEEPTDPSVNPGEDPEHPSDDPEHPGKHDHPEHPDNPGKKDNPTDSDIGDSTIDSINESLDLLVSEGKYIDAVTMCIENGKTDKASEICDTITDNSLAAQCYEIIGDYEKAAEKYESSGDYDKSASLYEQSGDPIKSDLIKEKIRTINPLPPELSESLGQYLTAARGYEKKENYVKAIECYNKIDDNIHSQYFLLGDSYILKCNGLARCYVYTNDYENAGKYYEIVGKYAQAKACYTISGNIEKANEMSEKL